MGAQILITGLLVVGCSAWSLWTLLPTGPRAWCRARLGLPPPAPAAGACSGCSGCTDAPPPAGRAQVVRIVRRPRA